MRDAATTNRWTRVLLGAALLGATSLAGMPAFAETVLHRGNAGEPQTFDQAHTSINIEEFVLKDLYEGLTVYDAAGKVVPGAAESWTVSDDGTVYTFKIRDAANWSDGTPVTAEDFAFSFRRVENPAEAANYANILYPIKNAEKVNKEGLPVDQLGVRAVDAKTLEVTLERPTPFFLELMAHQTALPVSKASVEKNGADFVKPGKLVSNGAYQLAEHVANDHLTATKNPSYWDAANVKIDKVIFYPLEDQAAAVRRYEAGELDVNYNFSADQLKRLREQYGDEVRVSAALATYYYVFDTRAKPFDDVRVRRALSMAIDRDFLANEIYAGSQQPQYAFVPPGLPDYGEPSAADYAAKDQLDREDEALALMKEAGFGEGGAPLSIEIRYNTNPNHERVATAVADMWKTTFGANVSLVNLDVSSHYAYLQEGGAFQVARAGWTADYGDPENFLAMNTTSNKTFNYAKWSDPEYDALMAKSYDEKDPAARAKLLHEAETILMREQPVAPLLVNNDLWLVSKRVVGWQDNANNQHLSRFLSIAE
ncbi:ABC transporter substrate-binding protein [Aureimonas sp. Leaf454]|uniref:peptide ABC transporter substrate-binding protein n=1 Tax=Aureimonas sp. Leaf454 TaxID=1736381 RepID=UPI0006F8D0EF|nr:peptide ABC transporter substrate-binding protein [Aureimonas sp. Leaf454]KQT49030.1 ABC transporter substrate-binding protein [Aureimonas sp. Leaf454]